MPRKSLDPGRTVLKRLTKTKVANLVNHGQRVMLNGKYTERQKSQVQLTTLLLSFRFRQEANSARRNPRPTLIGNATEHSNFLVLVNMELRSCPSHMEDESAIANLKLTLIG
jgi:hypothetical protein